MAQGSVVHNDYSVLVGSYLGGITVCIGVVVLACTNVHCGLEVSSKVEQDKEGDLRVNFGYGLYLLVILGGVQSGFTLLCYVYGKPLVSGTAECNYVSPGGVELIPLVKVLGRCNFDGRVAAAV